MQEEACRGGQGGGIGGQGGSGGGSGGTGGEGGGKGRDGNEGGKEYGGSELAGEVVDAGEDEEEEGSEAEEEVTDTGSGRNAEAIQATRGKERASNGGDDKIISDVVSNAGIKFFLSHYIY